ncbi:MAG: ABC transporter substrate-binding protein [Elusimicrobia bacterium]|nr:ABC transporter substrate-binding protein [Elusimicrobiota bacterium]
MVGKLSAACIIILTFMLGPFGCAKKEQQEIKIGAVLSITGSGAPYGEDAQRGIELAVNQINNKGGIKGEEVKLIVEDDQTDPKTSTLAVNKLISQDRVQVIIGAVTSSSMLADAPIAEKAKVVLLSPGASNPKITEAGDFIFRDWISDALEGKAMADYLYQREKVRKVAILYINNDYGTGLKEVFTERFKALGGDAILAESYNQDDTDFRSQLTKIKNARPERIYLPGYYKEMALTLKQAKEMGIKIPFRSVVTFEEPDLLKLAGKEAEGVIYSSPFYDPSSEDEHIRNFVTGFKNKYQREPGIFAAHGYDAVFLIADAIERRGYKGESIRDGLYEIRDFRGVSGRMSFDKNGDVTKPVAIKEIRNGKFAILETVSIN